MIRKELLLGALVADSLALTPHWIYDTQALKQRFGRVSGLLEPTENDYHFGQARGGQTHLGQQTIVLAQCLGAGRPFSEGLKDYWQDSTSYKDHATKSFLRGEGGHSTELAGASRSPAVLAFASSLEEALELSERQVRVTHNGDVAEAAARLTRLCFFHLSGETNAEERVFAGTPELKQAMDVLPLDPVPAIAKLGQSCSLSSALPSVLYFLLRAKDIRETLIDNVMVGGDSAARGLILGSLLVAKFGFDAVPKDWLTDLVYS